MKRAFDPAEVSAAAWLQNLDPRLKLAYLATLSTLLLLVDSMSALAVLWLASAAPLAAVRMRWRAWAVLLGILAAVVWATVLSQALFYPAEYGKTFATIIPPFRLWRTQFSGLRIDSVGARYGLEQSLRTTALVLAGLSVALTSNLQRLVVALTRLGVPISVSFTTLTAIRFLPLMTAEWGGVRQAARLRGYTARFFSRRLFSSLRMEVALLLPVLAVSLRRAATLSTSIAARGFDPTAPRTLYPPLRFKPPEILALVVLWAVLCTIATIKLLTWLAEAHIALPAALIPWTEAAQHAAHWL